MKNFKISYLLIALLAGGLFFAGCKKNEGCTNPDAANFDPDAEKDDGSCIIDLTETISDDGNGTGTTTWTADKEYVLDGFVFVNSGQTLTIEAGTVIKGKPGTGTNASALIVAKGARIIAEGTIAKPIIFTAQQDNVADTEDIPLGTRGLWGGLIVLGDAPTNAQPVLQSIEGIPTNEPRGQYGGTNVNDNSGVLKYISVRYGGSDIGSGNEINGVTFGGVGAGTVVEHIEVFANEDDGFEFFGGTVNTKWLAAAFCGDDAFDYDQGFLGQGQFWFSVNDVDDGDRGGEHDGGTNPENGTPFAKPVIHNATYIGRGAAAGKRLITFRDNAGGEYHNSIFLNFAKGIDIELLSSPDDSYKQFQDGNIVFDGCVFDNVADGTVSGTFQAGTDSDNTNAADQTELDNATSAIQSAFGPKNEVGATTGVGINGNNKISPFPSTVYQTGATPATGWFDAVSYKGAFGNDNWLSGWSALSEGSFF